MGVDLVVRDVRGLPGRGSTLGPCRGRHRTCDAVFHILGLTKEMPMARVAEKWGIGRHRVERVAGVWRRGMHVDLLRAQAIDEASVRKGRRSASMVTGQATRQVPVTARGWGTQKLDWNLTDSSIRAGCADG